MRKLRPRQTDSSARSAAPGRPGRVQPLTPGVQFPTEPLVPQLALGGRRGRPRGSGESPPEQDLCPRPPRGAGWLLGARRAPGTSACSGPAATTLPAPAPRAPRQDAHPPPDPRARCRPTGLGSWNQMVMARGGLWDHGRAGSGGLWWGARALGSQRSTCPCRERMGRAGPAWGPGACGCSTIGGSPRASHDGREASGSRAGARLRAAPGRRSSCVPCPGSWTWSSYNRKTRVSAPSATFLRSPARPRPPPPPPNPRSRAGGSGPARPGPALPPPLPPALIPAGLVVLAAPAKPRPSSASPGPRGRGRLPQAGMWGTPLKENRAGMLEGGLACCP